MSNLSKLSVLLLIVLASCEASQKSYFTSTTRAKLENNNIPMQKVQFYIDRDVELRRELQSADAKVTSGKIKFENGKYLNIIVLKKNTLGVCTQSNTGSLSISFEPGDNKTLNFAAGGTNIYGISPSKWIGRSAKVMYDGESYMIQSDGAQAMLLVNKSVTEKYEVKKRTMKGRKIDG